jgi:hypothetical protein
LAWVVLSTWSCITAIWAIWKKKKKKKVKKEKKGGKGETCQHSCCTLPLVLLDAEQLLVLPLPLVVLPLLHLVLPEVAKTLGTPHSWGRLFHFNYKENRRKEIFLLFLLTPSLFSLTSSFLTDPSKFTSAVKRGVCLLCMEREKRVKGECEERGGSSPIFPLSPFAHILLQPLLDSSWVLVDFGTLPPSSDEIGRDIGGGGHCWEGGWWGEARAWWEDGGIMKKSWVELGWVFIRRANEFSTWTKFNKISTNMILMYTVLSKYLIKRVVHHYSPLPPPPPLSLQTSEPFPKRWNMIQKRETPALFFAYFSKRVW